MALARPVEALDPSRAITQYVLESWIVKDGAPASTITGIAQTPGGYLWLGTEGDGLVRFDGVAFVRETSLDAFFGHRVDRVTSLLCGSDGALWVGTLFGLARWRDGRWTAFDRGEARHVFGLHEAPDGSVWYARHWEGIYRVAGETLTAVRLAGKPRFVTSDTRGTLWAGGYESLWRLAGGTQRLYTKRDGLRDQNVLAVYGDRSGDVWVGHQVGLTLLRHDKVVAHFTTRDGLSDDDISTIYVDRDGVLWVGTARGGLNRRRGDRFEALSRALGLTNDRVTTIYEDREGSLWVGTSGGLNRLRDADLLPIGRTEGLSRQDALSIVEGRDGAVYVASGFGGLNRIEDGRVRISPADSVPGSDFDGPLFADPDGGIWSGHRDGLVYRRDGRGRLYPVKAQVACIARDARGLVFASGTGEVFRLVNGKEERYRLADGSLLGPETFGFDYVWMIHVSREGTLWLATVRGAFAVRDGRAERVWTSGTLSANSISEDEEGTVWIGTMAGLVRVAGRAVTTFTTRHGLPHDDIYHALADRQGGVWMSSARGIFRVMRRELEAVALGRARTVAVEVFGATEGMRTSEATGTYQPAGCLTRDGRVWFTTVEGVVVADPTRRRRNPLPPPVTVEAVVADGRASKGGEPLLIPPGTERVGIHYNGLSLLVPQRVSFRYRLEGYDRDWVDARERRAAFYTKLPPGTYRFRVVAANNDGVWNEVGASVELRQLPHFYETSWFLIGAALAVTGSIWGAHRLRVRHHERLEKELEGRIREALARVKVLSGLLPICAWCKKVRDDTGYWSQIETYVREHSEADFSHGICPDCSDRLRGAGGVTGSRGR
jgi:ligand-binding sensor domain-containing protein